MQRMMLLLILGLVVGAAEWPTVPAAHAPSTRRAELVGADRSAQTHSVIRVKQPTVVRASRVVASRDDNLPSASLRSSVRVDPLGRVSPFGRAISGWRGTTDGQVGDANEPVFWVNVVGASASGNTLTKTATPTAWDAGAASANLIRDGYGYVEFTKTETAGRIMAGLSNGDSGVAYEDVDYAIHTDALGNIHIFEAGTYRGQVGTYTAGARFRVEVRHGVVRYLRNGQLLYTSGVAPRYPLRVDAELYDQGVAVTDVRVGSSTWSNQVGVTVTGSSLAKTGSAGWTSGAVTANTLEAGDGAMEFTATETNTTRAAGLSDGDVNQGLADIAYGIELHDDATLEVVEAGTSRGSFGSYAAGDRFRVQVVSGVVSYARNGTVFYTSTVAPSYPLAIDSALYSVGATLTDIVLIPLVWTDPSGVSIDENNLTKTAAEGWNAGASTSLGLTGDSGYLEFKAVETDARRTIGFKSGAGAAETYADLAYAIDLGATGTVTVFEDGTSRGTFGSYAHGDRFRIENAAGVVRYFRNGALIYTSSVTPTYPLYGDARLYTAGATVADLVTGTDAWLPPVNLTAMGPSLVKTGSATQAWDAEAISDRGYAAGFIEFTASHTTLWRHVGLTNGNNGTADSDLDYAIHLNQLGQVHVFEGATYVGYYGGYATGDRFRVELTGGTVRYLRNGSVFYTSGVAPTLPLRPDVNIYSPAASLFNIRTGGTLMVETPTFSPSPGTYTSAQTVSLATTTPSATIRYTVDGTTPTESSSIYTGPLSVGTSTTIKAVAFRTGWTQSATGSATYTMNFGTLALPGISPGAGSYTSEAAVTLTSISGATIRYTLNGSDPTPASTLYTASFAVTASATLKARAFHPDYTQSAVASAAYTIVVAAPTLTPGAGSYAPGQLITVATATAGAAITYTINGVDPVETDPVVPASGKVAAGNFTVKAKAWKTGATPSAVTAAAYTLTGDLVAPTITGAVFASFGLRADGTVWGWGRNDNASVGDGTSTARYNPIPIAGLTGVVAVGGGYYRNLALRLDGTVAGWGLNTSGEIGDGTLTNRTTPTAVVGLSDAVSLATGTSHALAIRANGTVVTWGYNGVGQLGDGTTTNRSTPVAIAGLTDVTAVAAGTEHSLVLRGDGTVWSWGANGQGQLGDGTTTQRLTPVQVSGLTGVVFIRAGNGSSMAIKADGTVWMWGWNFYGQLGDGTNTDRLTPVQMSGVTNAITGGIGWEYSLVLRSDGTVWTTGRNSEGQLGIPGGNRNVLGQITGLPAIARIAVGALTGFAVSADGAAWGWGRNAFANIGDGTTIGRAQPLQIAGPGLVWRPWIPVIGLASGQYTAEQNPVISNEDPSAVMHYSLTGVDPTEADPTIAAGASVAITQSATLKVRSFKTGAPASEISAATYTLRVLAPTFSPAPGTYNTTQNVTLATATSGATIRYTVDGGTPTAASPAYSSALPIASSATIKAFASRSGWTSSDIATAAYWIAPADTLAAPTITPATGTYPTERIVTIVPAESEAVVRYTLDGTDPTERSSRYVRAFGVAQTTTVKARTFKSSHVPGPIATATLTISAPGLSTSPTISPLGGRFTTQRLVTITGPSGATLRYTTNGADPTTSDTTIVSGNTVTVDRSMVLKVRAWESGLAPSLVRREDYVITGMISAGEAHSIAIKADGTVWTWGDNWWAQIGDGGSATRTTPYQAMSGAVAVAGGFHHNLVLKADGTVWAWGQNWVGEVGDGTATERRSPVQVSGLTNVVAIAAGFYASYAIKADGTLWAWGGNWWGQLGDGTSTNRWTPVQVTGLTGVTSVAAGDAFAVAVTSHGATTGRAWAWGHNAQGQLGNGSTTFGLVPELVMTSIAVKRVTAGRAWAMALTSDDELLLWGSNDYGAQANGTINNGSSFINNNLRPTRTGPWAAPVADLASGHSHGLVLSASGVLWGWGRNCEFELAYAPCDYRLTIEPIPAFTTAVEVSAGSAHSIAAAVDGQVWGWGHNGHGQMGDGTLTWRSVPVQVSGLLLVNNSFLAGDQDNDGLITWREYLLGTDPLSVDTDGDGIGDALDVAGGAAGVNLDPDTDGLSNALEAALGTDAYNADTDGDSVADGVDAFPLDPTRSQAPAPNPNDTTPPVITLIYPTNARPIGGGL